MFYQLLNVGLRRPPGRKIITNVSVNDDVQLKTTENAWKAGMKRDSVIEDQETLKTRVCPSEYSFGSVYFAVVRGCCHIQGAS